MTGTCRRDHITPVLCSLHWLPVSERIKYKPKVLLVTFKVIHSVVPHPSYLADLLKPYVPERSLRSAGKGLLCVPKVSKTIACIGRRAFAHSALILWNSVDPDLHTPTAIGTFRKSLKTYLYSGIYRD